MNFQVYAVLDSKAGFFGQPFFAQNDGSAIRDFSDAVKDGSNPNNMWFKHPEDFSLYCIGVYDNQTAELAPCHPKALITASALKSIEGVPPDEK